MLLNAVKIISVSIFLAWVGPNEYRNSKLNFTPKWKADSEIKLYVMCREYAENELQRQRIAVIILILFSLVYLSPVSILFFCYHILW